MQSIDWLILGSFSVVLFGVAIYLRKYTQSVADFLAANRCAGRYLLTIAEGASGIGAITVVAQFEIYYGAGFTPALWELLIVPSWMILSLAGWIIYRFRQTRALTMAQFMEMRYGRSFRIFSGLTAFVAGIVNYGIFPAVTARFFMSICGWPDAILVFGIEVSVYATTIAVLLALALFITLNGGQIVIIVTDFIQGQFINIVFVVATIVALVQFGWIEIGEVMAVAPEGASRVNPFDTARAGTFSLWFFLIVLFQRFYGYMVWQGSQGYNASAVNPHEARMARILSQWRAGIMLLVPMVLAVCAYTAMHHPEYSGIAESINAEIAQIENSQLQTQMTTPIAVRYILPAGILGLFVTMMFAAGVSTDSTYLHSWGSIFLQDVVMPFRRKPFSQKTHLLFLRGSILGVAVFAFLFSLYFVQTEYILPFFMFTGSLFTAGAGICIIGGLYWSRGTNAGAWAAMAIGVVLVTIQFSMDRLLPGLVFNPDYLYLVLLIIATVALGVVYVLTQNLTQTALSVVILLVICGLLGFAAESIWSEGRMQYLQLMFITKISSICAYVAISLITGHGDRCDMDRILHRGRYAIGDDETQVMEDSAVPAWQRRLGINHDFTRSDRIIYYATIVLLLSMLGTFFGCLGWHVLGAPTHEDWMRFWYGFLIASLSVFGVATVWMLIGGVIDLRKMFQRLNAMVRDASDDGFVVKEEATGTVAGGLQKAAEEAKEP